MFDCVIQFNHQQQGTKTMTDLTTLKTAQAAAFAAWKACPDKDRAEKARLAAELGAATKAVAAAKKAAEPAAPIVDRAAALADWNEKQAAKAAENDLRNRVWSAVVAYNKAQEWPRCGQRWGKYAGEAAAEALIRANLILAKQLVEERD